MPGARLPAYPLARLWPRSAALGVLGVPGVLPRLLWLLGLLGRFVGLLDRRDLELQRDALGHQHPAGVERHVPLQAEVAAVDPAGALESRTELAEGVLLDTDQLERD